MKHKLINAFLIICIPILSCSSTTQKVPPNSSYKGASFSRPYVIRGIKYYPLREVASFKQKGLASWYGSEEHGSLTANGEIYDMYALTAAHKTLPLGSYVHVTNLKNNKSLIVRINDRGPFIKGRIIDLSYTGASKLDFLNKGTTRVKIALLSEDPDTLVIKGHKIDIDKGNYAVQLGSFKNYNNALNLSHMFDNGQITSANIRGTTYYRVQITGFNSRKKAEKLAKNIRKTFPNAFITAID